MEDEVRGAPPHVAAEFYLWLWYRSEHGEGELAMDDDGGDVSYWVDDRIAFRPAGEEKVTAVLTGENPSTTPEARAALAGGKVLRDLKLALKRGEREYQVTLKGSRVEIGAAKLPGQLKGGDIAEIVYERAFLYEELHYVMAKLFTSFAQERCSEDWHTSVLPGLRAWAQRRPDEDYASSDEG